MPHPQVDDQMLDSVSRIAREAGSVIMSIYRAGFTVTEKRDASPVTEADVRAEAVILAGLRELAPEIPVVAEESVAAGRLPEVGERFWLVDPLDGTREFIDRNGEFTVNIALVEKGRPVLGVVFAPALGSQGQLYAGRIGQGAHLKDGSGVREIRCRAVPEAGLAVVASRSHGDVDTLRQFLSGRPVDSIRSVGSSLKLCLVAAGQADLYPRLGPTMQWDTAAGQAILEAAGGSVRQLDDGEPLAYGKSGFANREFVACGLT
jgi:3'(2'), 5'-bisphosphate nucleotidase